jgi:hypothetical protein
MVKTCDDVFEVETFLNLDPIDRLEHILNLRQIAFKKFIINLDKILETDKEVTFRCFLPFDTLENFTVSSYTEEKYLKIDLTHKKITNRNMILLKCTKNPLYSDKFEVFKLTSDETTENLIVEIDLHYVEK